MPKPVKWGCAPPVRGVLLAKEVVNPSALRYWRRYVCAITDHALVRRLQPLGREIEHNTFWFKFPDGRTEFQWKALISIQKKWEEMGKGPLLKLHKSDIEAGWDALEKAGVPRGAKIVTLHVRDQSRGKLGEKVMVTPTAHRDAEIATYYPAIKAITDRGYWVIRMGDISMKQIPKMNMVIDYPHTELRSDWMDLFCIGSSTFYLGTASGLCGVPINFGIPIILTNVSPMSSYPLSKNDIYLPKLLRSDRTGKILSFKETLSDPFGMCYNTSTYHHFQVSIMNNTPDEITASAIEMMDRIEGNVAYSSDDEKLQARFHELAAEYQHGGIACRISKDFIRRYEGLLP